MLANAPKWLIVQPIVLCKVWFATPHAHAHAPTRALPLLSLLRAGMRAYVFLAVTQSTTNAVTAPWVGCCSSVNTSPSGQEQEHEIRQRVDLLSRKGRLGSTDSVSASVDPNPPQERRRVLLMMEAAERELGNWSAFLPGPSTRTTDSVAPACADVSLHSVLGEVRACNCVVPSLLLPCERGCPAYIGCD